MLDPKALAEITGQVVREHVAKSIAPLVEENGRLRERIAVLEARETPRIDVDLIRGLIVDAVAAFHSNAASESALDFAKLAGPVVEEHVRIRERLATLEAREPPAVDIEQVRGLVSEAVAALPPPQPGKDGQDFEPDMAEVERILNSAVERRFAEMAPPKDGTSVTTEDVRPLIDEAVAAAVSALPTAKDGIGLAGALIDREGDLVVTLTDGTMRTLGRVVGRDFDAEILERAVADAVALIPTPKDGEPGADADPAVIQRMVDEAVAMIPKPKDGEPGKDAYAGTARGLWDVGAEYRAMDVVSFNGSEWRAKRDDPGELPGDGWMLSAARGKRGAPGDPGKSGSPGQSIVAGYVDTKNMAIILTREDGEEINIDFYDLAQVIKNA